MRRRSSTVLRETYNPLILAMRRLDKPIVAAVNGVAAGAGLALALACDLRIAADTATFVLAFGRVGLVPDSGTTWFLPRLVGPARAAELALIGDPLDGRRRRALGPRQPRRPGGGRARRGPEPSPRALAAAAPLALALTKRALNRSLDATLEAQLEDEAALQGVAGAIGGPSRGRRRVPRRSVRRGSPGSNDHGGRLGEDDRRTATPRPPARLDPTGARG